MCQFNLSTEPCKLSLTTNAVFIPPTPWRSSRRSSPASTPNLVLIEPLSRATEFYFVSVVLFENERVMLPAHLDDVKNMNALFLSNLRAAARLHRALLSSHQKAYWVRSDEPVMQRSPTMSLPLWKVIATKPLDSFTVEDNVGFKILHIT